jgi:predicted nucleic acid-binding protein
MRDVRVFIDTNVILYLHDRKEATKRQQALAWLRFVTEKEIARTNLQVLNEFSHILLRKKWLDTPEAVYALFDEFAEFGDSPLTRSEVVRARVLHSRFQYAWWDSLLLASALELGCTHFLSEDLQDGQAIEGLTIVDPFAHTPEQIIYA